MPQQAVGRSAPAALTGRAYVPFVQGVLEAARRHRGLSRHRVRMAGRQIALAFGGGGVEADYVARMGEPVASSDREPDFTFFALTAADLGLDPLPQWHDPAFPVEGTDSLMRRAGLRGERPIIPNVFRWFDPATRVGVLLFASHADLPLWHGGGPLVELVRWALADHGLRVVHGATLGLSGRGLLLLGDGGAGKSGTTLAGLRAGLQSVGDDYVAVGFEEDRPVARHLYNFMKQDPAGLARHAGHPVAGASGKLNWHGKVEFDPRPFFPGCLVERIELGAVLLPRVRRDLAVPQVSEVSATDALRYAMRTNLFNEMIDDALHFLARLMRVPRYRIDLGPDPVANGAALRNLVEAL